MNTTPTPGDLSARLLARADSIENNGVCTHDIGCLAAELREAAAALSALPAAGGSELSMHDANGKLCEFAMRWRLDGDYLRCKECNRPHIASALDTEFRHADECKNADAEPYPWRVFLSLLRAYSGATPQPSAAEELGPHPLNTCPKCKDYYMDCECPADAAVGAQGDGCTKCGAEWPAKECACSCIQAAPGKGVDRDAWLNEAVKLLCDLTGEESPTDDVRMDHMCDVARRIAALTRQPVAGDGIRNGYRHVVHELLTNIKRAAIRGRCGKLDDSNFIATCDHVENLADEALSYIAPAATPTDGGEG